MTAARPENRGLGEALFDTIDKTMPALQNMKISLKYIAPGRAGFEMQVSPGFSNSRGTAHGGVIAAFADTVMGYAGISLDLMLVTLEMNLNYFAPAGLGEKLEAEGWVVHAGRTTVVAEAEIRDSGRRLVAKSRGTYFPVGRISEL
mgnify:CR=1 FL=1